MQDFNETLCGKIANQVGLKLRNYHGSVLDETISRDILNTFEVDECFVSLKTHYPREQYYRYEKYFNYKVHRSLCTTHY